MYTLKSIEGPVLVEYYRSEDKKIPVFVMTNNILVKGYKLERGVIKGMVISIGDGVIGWSLCNKKDVFNKEIAIDMAIKRAFIADSISLRARDKFYSKLPFSLNEVFNRMEERSEKYFKYDSN